MGCPITVDVAQVFEYTVTFVGLDGSGKSHIVFRLTNNDASRQYVSIPTAGVAYGEFLQGLSTFHIYDCGGLGRYREQWLYYVEQSDAVIFVIDRSDKTRMGRVRAEIADIIKKCKAQDIPLLVLANKTDLRSKLTIQDFAKITKIAEAEIEYDIRECSALSNEGIQAAKDWVISHIRQKRANPPGGE
jgi:small GTP-binding protein